MFDATPIVVGLKKSQTRTKAILQETIVVNMCEFCWSMATSVSCKIHFGLTYHFSTRIILYLMKEYLNKLFVTKST